MLQHRAFVLIQTVATSKPPLWWSSTFRPIFSYLKRNTRNTSMRHTNKERMTTILHVGLRRMKIHNCIFIATDQLIMCIHGPKIRCRNIYIPKPLTLLSKWMAIIAYTATRGDKFMACLFSLQTNSLITAAIHVVLMILYNTMPSVFLLAVNISESHKNVQRNIIKKNFRSAQTITD